MRTRLCGVLGALVVLTSGVSVSAQSGPIVAKLFDGTNTSYQDFPGTSAIIVTVGTVTGLLTVTIYDVDTLSGAPTRNIPHVTISGSVGTGSPVLEVVLADGDTAFPGAPNSVMFEGAIDFAGLSFSSTGLRDITRVAVAVAGDITGNIEAGAIRRIQAQGRGSGGSYAGGKIAGNITATAPDFSGVTGGFRAIGLIWAGDEISGTIAATSDDETNPGGLTWLLIGHESNSTPVGLLGDVRIDYGTIEKVHTALPGFPDAMPGAVSTAWGTAAGSQAQSVFVKPLIACFYDHSSIYRRHGLDFVKPRGIISDRL